MAIEVHVLGPLEARCDGRTVSLGGPRQRGTLALLATQPNTLIPAGRLIDELWLDEPPPSAANLLQGYVSGLRKALGRETIETVGAGYVLRLEPAALDLGRFERLARSGSIALEQGRPAEAAATLAEALGLWRGGALADLADEPFLQATAGRLDELRLLALERRIEADIALGRDRDVVAEIEELVVAHPLRERLRGLLMLAYYRSGRQAEALASFRDARETLVGMLGIEPGPWLRELEAAILRQDPSLTPAAPSTTGAAPAAGLRSVLLAVFSAAALGGLAELAVPLVREPVRDLVAVTTVSSVDELTRASERMTNWRTELVGQGVPARAAVFTSLVPGADLARFAREQDVDLLLVDAPDALLEDARVLALLQHAPCDVGVVVGGTSGDGAVLVPFTGAEHDWAAVELGAWLARNCGCGLRLAGSAAGPEGADASRLLANASIAVQRVIGVDAEPLLTDPSAEALVAAAAGARAIIVGLTDRWRRDGLGRARTALALEAAAPTILVRRGVRPGGLAPVGSETRFTWTVAG
jgi:DNA-binding SARP family transcriptional activator